MFTGLVEQTGRIERVSGSAAGRDVRIATALGAELANGDSVSVNGVCLTVTAHDAAGFDAHVSPETLAVTTFAVPRANGLVNLERPIAAGQRFGGHFVLGHVDAVGEIASIDPDGDSWWLEISAPQSFAPYLIAKGSIAIDGISLTIASLSGSRVAVQVIPFTFEHTTLREARAGDPVNLEGDVLGKFVARQLELRALDTASHVGGRR